MTVATYFWRDPATKHKFEYTPDDVRRLKRAVAKNLTEPHRFAVITDRPHMFDADSDIVAIPLDRTKYVSGTCFCRLMTFRPDGRDIIGGVVLQLDLDTLIVGNIDHVVSRREDLVLWRNPSRIPWDKPDKPGRPYYNTSILLHRCGTKPELWADFDPKNPRCRDDQWWLADRLGPEMPHYSGKDGVYRLGREDTPGSGVFGELPYNACVVTFPGSEGKWWEDRIRAANPWIERHLAA